MPLTHGSGDMPDWPTWPQIDIDAGREGLGEVLRSAVWTVRVPGSQVSQTERAEAAFSAFCGSRYALLVSSGTTAVELAIRALAPSKGAKVIVPALGWFATAAAVTRAGAQPVFADVRPETSCIDPASVEELLDEDVVAVVAVHLHCAVADLHSLLHICESNGLTLIEDCAQAHGATYANRSVGTFGGIGCFSFNQEKLLAIGEGGCVVTSDDSLYQRLHALRTDGYVRRPGTQRAYTPNGQVMGGNGCTTEFAAALLDLQLAAFPRQQAIRNRTGARLINALQAIPGVLPLASERGTTDRSFYEFGFILDLNEFGGIPLDRCALLLSDALGFPIHRTDEPTETCPLLGPFRRRQAPRGASELYDSMLIFHHRILLDDRICTLLPDALERLRTHAEEYARDLT